MKTLKKITFFFVLSSILLVCLFSIKLYRRNARLNAIRIYAESVNNCDKLSIMYKNLEIEEAANANKSPKGSYLQIQHLANSEYYKSMAKQTEDVSKKHKVFINDLKEHLND